MLFMRNHKKDSHASARGEREKCNLFPSGPMVLRKRKHLQMLILHLSLLLFGG